MKFHHKLKSLTFSLNNFFYCRADSMKFPPPFKSD